MGADAFIHKKQSPLTKNWFGRITKTLDKNYEQLKQNPARDVRDHRGKSITVDGKTVRSKYPLRW